VNADAQQVYPLDLEQWHAWLAENHATSGLPCHFDVENSGDQATDGQTSTPLPKNPFDSGHSF